MKNQNTLSASLVLYQNNPEMVRTAVLSLLQNNIDISLSVIDNSPLPELATVFQDINVDYYYNQGENIGFGKAHNLALCRVKAADYHLVINPDIYFDDHVIPELLKYLEENKDIGLISPKISYPNGELQYLCKRYPSFLLLLFRRFIPKQLQVIFKRHLDWYEMRETGYDKIIDVPYLSGCFMLFRRKYLDEIGYFDENIFMYLEDADITLRMAKKYRTVFYPHVHIFHHWAKGSYKSLKLTLINIQSAIYFFNKHGWKLF
jgi:GT2 family glycosyltransferase